jgi:6-phosphogluconate dehydrogenase
MAQAEIGLIGLGVMGSNLALNIAEKGFPIAVYNRTTKATTDFAAGAGVLASQITPCTSLEEFVAAIRPPRPVIIMVQAGDAVDQQMAALKPLLAGNDIIIDAGNANFRDTMRRFESFKDTGLTFIGMGVSGGEEGARHGPSIMVGGAPESYARVEKVLTAISAKYFGADCCAYLGPNGAGHFVKTIHNGIEYADMQMIAEIYGVLRDGLSMAPKAIGEVFTTWNKGNLNSYLIEITAKVLKAVDPKSGKPMVDVIVDSAGQKGTGRWSVIEAQMMGVPATAIEAAVAARGISSMLAERNAASLAYGKAVAKHSLGDPESLLKKLELALFAGKIAAYAQGFAVLEAASKEFGWSLPMATIARIWREGCIIRSQFLDTIATAYEANPGLANLLLAPEFVKLMKTATPALRHIVARGAQEALPLPALSSALSYFDSYVQARGTANIIQAQRDFFGAHGFARIGEEGLAHHGPWGSGLK